MTPNAPQLPEVLAVRPTPFANDMRLYMLSHSGQIAKKQGSSFYEWQGTMLFVTALDVEDEQIWQKGIFNLIRKGDLPCFGKAPRGVDISFNWTAYHGALLPNGDVVKCAVTLGYSAESDYSPYAEENA